MSNRVLKIILICILFVIASFITFTVIKHFNKVSISNNTNIKKGDILTFDDIKIEVLNVASALCDENSNCDEHYEVSVKVIYNDNKTYYTLDTYSNSKQRIDNSNYYILCNIEKDDQIKIDVKDKTEI